MTPNPTAAAAIDELVSQLKFRFRLVMLSAGVACVVLCCVIAYVLASSANVSQEIQNQRYTACIAQNQRHDKALTYIISLVDQDQHLSATKKATAIREDHVLFQALAPHTRCARTVHPLNK